MQVYSLKNSGIKVKGNRNLYKYVRWAFVKVPGMNKKWCIMSLKRIFKLPIADVITHGKPCSLKTVQKSELSRVKPKEAWAGGAIGG